MHLDKMDTDIQRFYRNKTVFVTGGTGFMGIVFVEKLLRATEVKRIYLLIRPKKDKTVDERLEEMFQKPLFDELKKTRAYSIERVKPILGDCALPNLGISTEDCKLLIEEVNMVLHCAATVRFNDPLHKAVLVNVRATVDLLQMAKQMLQLEAFVHVSSAFANCAVSTIDEKYYAHKLGISAVQICEMANTLGADTTNRLESVLCQSYPNTYTYTKSLAEEAILSEGRSLPICIFRPGIVIQTAREPLVGWVGNFYGPSTALYGCARGVLRVLYIKMNSRAHLVPADYCANLMAAIGWETSKSKRESLHVAPPIYNYINDDDNPLFWATYINTISSCGRDLPLNSMIWCPVMVPVGKKWLYVLLSFIYHTIPGYICDFLLTLKGKKRRMVELYRKIYIHTNLSSHFITTEYKFSMDNTKALWKTLSPGDQDIFTFDLCSLDWKEYLYSTLMGMRLYLGNEGPETLPDARKRHKKFVILHRTLKVLICGILVLLLWTLLKTVL